ncbi:MAG: MarR family transcriptional regulator [Desulfosarcinaceae bacterium]|nr:MarR family transcriptional regulator [Desulfosarcinaceae bacterium]
MNQFALHPPSSIAPDQTERFQRLILGLYQCCQNRIQRQALAFDLPDAELRCLRLFDGKNDLTPKEIALQMGVVKSRITKIIDGLVSKGLIHRSRDPDDSRVSRLRVTTRGAGKLAAINQSLAASNEMILARMTPAQRTALLRHLEVLKASMEAVV